MRLPVNHGVVGLSGIDPKRLTDVLAQIITQLNGISEGSVSATHNAMTAAPTTGTWNQGDFIRNKTPSGGSPVLGFICTVSGTPGTWDTVP
jgi:hypothetical protein